MSDGKPAPETTKGLLRISIITVAYNSGGTIRQTIESVLSQRYPHIEYIVVDGGSKDDTMSIVREYDGKIDTVVTERDRGIYDAMNKGIGLATGDFVGFLNSDDFYADDDVISDLAARLAELGTDSIFADLTIVDRKDTSKIVRLYQTAGFRPWHFRFGWMPPHPTFFVRRAIYQSTGPYSLDYRVAADFEMLARLLVVRKISFTHLARSIVVMRDGGASMGGWRQSLLINREVVRACRENDIATNLALVLLKTPAKLLERLKGGGLARRMGNSS